MNGTMLPQIFWVMFLAHIIALFSKSSQKLSKKGQKSRPPANNTDTKNVLLFFPYWHMDEY